MLRKKLIDYLTCHKSFLRHQVARSMSTHLDRTKDVPRMQQGFSSAKIVEISNATPTIKKLVVHVDNNNFTFKAGQWVDFHIPGVSTMVGGYSMYSSPLLLQQQQLLHLAVKYSTHPPALWVHEKCKAGSEVTLQVGGEFFFDANESNISENILLIAGGVGINPMLSIYQNIYDNHKKYEHLREQFGTTNMLYSATTDSELAFKDVIEDIVCTDNSMTSSFYVTKDENVQEDGNSYHKRRINESDIKNALHNIEPSSLVTYICGRDTMMVDMKEMLLSHGVLEKNVLFESWW